MEAKIKNRTCLSHATWIVFAGALALAPGAFAGEPAARRIAGVLTAAAELDQDWPWSGAWIYPVGDPQAFERPDSAGAHGYRLLRGVRAAKVRRDRHQGADWGNRSAGGTIRAAAHGVVVRVVQAGSAAYGDHVVIAHRLPEGDWAYSVYAHFLPGTIRVDEGDVVAAGTPIGRVGRTGNATADHLHFEIRRTADPTLRWEVAPVVDPVRFVAERLPAAADSSWARTYLEWAEMSALIARNAPAERTLDRSTWWGMLARAARHSIRDLPSDLVLVRDLLAELGVVAPAVRAEPEAEVEWSEMRGDLDRLAAVGVRVPGAPRDGEAKSRAPEREDRPTLADACAAMARVVERRQDRSAR